MNSLLLPLKESIPVIAKISPDAIGQQLAKQVQEIKKIIIENRHLQKNTLTENNIVTKPITNFYCPDVRGNYH